MRGIYLISIWEFLDTVAFQQHIHLARPGLSRGERTCRGLQTWFPQCSWLIFSRINLNPDDLFRCCSPLAHDLPTFKSGFHSTLATWTSRAGWMLS